MKAQLLDGNRGRQIGPVIAAMEKPVASGKQEREADEQTGCHQEWQRNLILLLWRALDAAHGVFSLCTARQAGACEIGFADGPVRGARRLRARPLRTS
ncbi:MAG: hypothetical protein HC850_17485, partial [Rhodomicrobium sp.]|nr:hypothetical protein [Rhodomicrobium sp.]